MAVSASPGEVAPRLRLAYPRSPLESLERLSDHLGGPRIRIKRDDCAGLPPGGNSLARSAALRRGSVREVSVYTSGRCKGVE